MSMSALNRSKQDSTELDDSADLGKSFQSKEPAEGHDFSSMLVSKIKQMRWNDTFIRDRLLNQYKYI